MVVSVDKCISIRKLWQIRIHVDDLSNSVTQIDELNFLQKKGFCEMN